MMSLATAITTCFVLAQPTFSAKSYPRNAFAGVAAVSDGGGTTVIGLDDKHGKQLQGVLTDHTQRILQQTQDQMQRSFANSDRFSRNLQAHINADIQRSLANAFGGFNMGMGGMGDFGGFDNMQNNFFSDMTKSIADTRKLTENLNTNINQVLEDAARTGGMNVVSASAGPGDSVVAASSVVGGKGGSGVVVTGGSGNGKMLVVSNTPVKINGKEYRPGQRKKYYG